MGFFSFIWRYDKYVHFMEYLFLGILLVNALKIRHMTQREWFMVLLFLILFPILDESIQHFTPGRIPDVWDGITDIMGGLIGATFREQFS